MSIDSCIGCLVYPPALQNRLTVSRYQHKVLAHAHRTLRCTPEGTEDQHSLHHVWWRFCASPLDGNRKPLDLPPSLTTGFVTTPVFWWSWCHVLSGRGLMLDWVSNITSGLRWQEHTKRRNPLGISPSIPKVGARSQKDHLFSNYFQCGLLSELNRSAVPAYHAHILCLLPVALEHVSQ